MHPTAVFARLFDRTLKARPRRPLTPLGRTTGPHGTFRDQDQRGAHHEKTIARRHECTCIVHCSPTYMPLRMQGVRLTDLTREGRAGAHLLLISSHLVFRRVWFKLSRFKLKVQCSTFNVQCSMFNVQCSTFNVQRSTFGM
ncbi:hypothetical protein EDB83DRAFT_1109540 [Lactarius deliciosus]|nr:hypothetical protein EDB83DRAFT_1109540 [Lactarius deliciosus]